jgi:hypothetical protein
MGWEMAVELDIAVDMNVSPSLHPQIVASMDDYDDSTSGDLQQVVEAFRVAYEGVSKVVSAREAAKLDPTMTEPARVVRIADHADRVGKDAAARFDKVTANMQSGIALLEKELTAPVQARAAHTIAVEIRAHIKGLASDQRLGFVRNAINRGDADTVSSVLGAPSYLSGIEPEAQAILLRMWHEKANPVAAKRLRAMQGALDLLGTKAPLLHRELERAIGVDHRKVKQFREAKNKADRAFSL